jgi:hypothetical protein
VGSKVCATCHAEIYKKYLETTMAKASGAANRAIIPGEFLHKPSKVHYRIYEENGKAWLSFDRAKDRPLQGKRELQCSVFRQFLVDEFHLLAVLKCFDPLFV